MEKQATVARSWLIDRILSNSKSTQKLMVIVDHENLNLLDRILKLNKPGMQIMYILTDSQEIRMNYKYSSRIYPLKINIRSLLRHDIVDEILCCVSSFPKNFFEDIKEICYEYGVSLVVPAHIDMRNIKIKQKKYFGRYCFNVLETTPRKLNSFVFKNWLEISFAAFSLFVLSPVLLLIAIAIKSTSKGPVIFKQLRVGLRGRKFYIYKFRTMISNAEQLKNELIMFNEADGPAFKIKNDPRITTFGKFLRKTGLDEMPQLYNVILGDMSLIGPRPLLPSEVSLQQEWQLKRMCIKPGITCTWQIQPDRNTLPFDQWMKLDREYVEHWTFSHDVRIFFSTVKSIFSARGV
jgi:lipopolysaccharide/colanic/teichoic acid biosynthesis glycosyltransferase